ncbi:hypothetical protein H0V99_00335 [Candidatus Saccharibacteria bacterium]|nr:hypothetical protein [Candidatus Saccharibacteria bacterium]
MDPNQNPVVTSPKQQVAEHVRQAANVLVTVRSNPTVDELAATIGLTLMLNKLGKHATAVFSGPIPSTLEFLKPEETLETNTNSLRDFIVSLDKSKADKLRYKVEENVVKIFITPYRTSITQDDLEFSQGDFNVDVVMALGVTQREELDQAIVSHGRILHDATVVTITAGQRESSLGGVNWQEPAASSLCEMLVSISEAFQGGLIDAQIATAFLTGIVAETQRFSNTKTTPKVMTMAAQLMASGANQQLIANELQKAEPDAVSNPLPLLPVESVTPVDSQDGALSIEHVESKAVEENPEQPEELPALPEAGVSLEEPEPVAETPLAAEQPSFGSILPPPPVLDVPEPNNSDQIHIDPDGNIMPSNQSMATRHKVIEPLEQAAAPILPDSGATVTSAPFSAFDTGNSPSTPVESPAVNSEPAAMLPTVAEPTDTPEPQGPNTLLDIEKSVHSPHVEQVAASDGGVDMARSAVMDAITQAPYDPTRPDPRADINAQPMGMPPDPLAQLTQSAPPQQVSDDLSAPPPVPPPLMPQ